MRQRPKPEPAPSRGASQRPDTRALRAMLDRCLTKDRGRFIRELAQVEGKRKPRPGQRPPEPARLRERIEASVAARQQRAEALPKPTFPPDLPVSARREEIAKAITDHQVIVLCGETGSGKTTQLPKICLELGRGAAGLIGHTQPRRIAARTVAQRIADELGTPLGQRVGYKVRFTDKSSADANVKLMTDGILLAETQSDRLLSAYDTLIIDEAHERSLNIDFLLGYLRQILPKRRDLKVIITSATIDPDRFSDHFAGAPIIEVSGRTYPVDVEYHPLVADVNAPDHDPDAEPPSQSEAIAHAVADLWRRQPVGQGDVLVFLPGEREIREAHKALRDHPVMSRRGAEVLPLYSRLSNAEQNRVFAHSSGHRVVLATNVAETSLTVPGIRYVIDTGEARISRYSARNKVQHLQVEPISRASADQRKGRCGRIGAGVCVRLYAEEDFKGRDEYTPPEILRTNLAAVILQMKSLRLGRVEDFPFMDPPEPRMIRDGYDTLRELGALDDEDTLTDIGRQLARLPIDPRIGRMIVAGHAEDCLHDVLIIASALSIQDPRERPIEKRDAADQAHAFFADPESDFIAFLKLWDEYLKQKEELSSSRLRKWCVSTFLSYIRMREWQDIHRQLVQLVREMGWQVKNKRAEPEAIHRALLTGLLSNIATKGDKTYEYTGARGLKLAIFPGSGVFSTKPKWIIAAELVRTTKLYAREVAKVDPMWIERAGEHLLSKRYGEPYWDEKGAYVAAPVTISLFGLELSKNRRENYANVDAAKAREIFIWQGLVEGLLATRGRFMEHNRRLLGRIEALQSKFRRVDLLVAAQERFDFYNGRIPKHVTSGATFEKWRKRAEDDDPDLLFMREADLLANAEPTRRGDLYPDEVEIAGVRCPITYVHDPSSPEDGATLTIPVDALNQLDGRRLGWLIPGHAEGKLEAMIRALPKDVRRGLVPAPESAARAAGLLDAAAGTFEDAAASALSTLAQVRLSAAAWTPDAIPPHLRVRLRVIDEAGETIAEGRDLRAIRMELSGRLRARFASVPHPDYNRDGLTEWDFDELPKRIDVEHMGVRLAAYPTLLDAGDGTVSVRLLESRDAAVQLMRTGLRRLFAIHMEQRMGFDIEDLPGMGELIMRYAYLGPRDELRDDLHLLTAERAFLYDDHQREVPAWSVRSTPAYENRLDEGWNRMRPSGEQAAALVQSIVGELQPLLVRLAEPLPATAQEALDDIRAHLDRLTADRFLTRVPYRWLAQYPRYLRAVSVRLDKLSRRDIERDRQSRAYLAQLWNACAHRMEQHKASGVFDQALDDFAWMLEEMRVSLFAQELGTAVPVSPKRLAEQWEKVRA